MRNLLFVSLCRFMRGLSGLLRIKAICELNPNPEFGVMNLPLGRRFLKFEMKKNALREEISRRESMPSEIKTLFCPLTCFHLFDTRVASLPRYRPFSDPTSCFALATSLHESFHALGTRRSSSIEESPDLIHGLQTLGRYTSPEMTNAVRKRLEEVLEHHLSVGPVHGDFHYRNIVATENGSALLIDADCYRSTGIQLFDSMYYALEAAVIEHADTRGWLEELLCAIQEESEYKKWLIELDSISENEALLLYFIDRLGQEDRFIPHLTDRSILTLEEIVRLLLAPRK